MSPSPFTHPFESTPPVSAPPSDPDLHNRIDKLVEYVAKNGPEFEALIREKQQDNPAYNFLFGAEGHNYYRYKLWLTTRAISPNFNPPFPPSSIPSSHSPTLNGSPLNPSNMGVAAGPPTSVLPASHPPSFPTFYDQHQQSLPFLSQTRTEYEPTTKGFKGLSGPLPSDVAAELNNVLSNLNGTKDSIKGAKTWFMQRSPFAPALAEALRDRMFTLDDSERQLHIIFLANDILFDSLQRRINLQELDNEAHAFQPVLGSMLARAYNNPVNKDENQSRLERILDFWAAKEVYHKETIASLEKEMTGGLPLRSSTKNEKSSLTDIGAQQMPPQLQQNSVPSSLDRLEIQPLVPAVSSQFVSPLIQQFPSNQLPGSIYPQPGLLPIPSVSQTIAQPHLPHLLPGSTPNASEQAQAPPPYPLFPPGLIPGMVRKMQIGSGVPYSPLSPLDIPTVIPPSTVMPSEILDRVSKFFKEIGEVNPSEGPMKASQSSDDEYEGEPVVRKGGACIPPPASLQQADPETGMFSDGTFDCKPGSSSSGRLGLGATADPNEVSQYDDVYSSYRKERSSNYHTSMSARAGAR